MKPHPKHSGIILLYVILLLLIIGPATVILTGTVRQNALKTRRLRLETDCMNMLFSARAWAQQHRQQLSDAPDGRIFRLDPNQLDIPNGACDLFVLPNNEAGQPRIRIHTKTAIGRMSRSKEQIVTLSK